MAADLFASFRAIDRALHEKGGVPLTGGRWLAEVERFYRGTAKEWVAAVGRGAGKTQQSVKMAIAETLFGDHAIPAGEQHFFCFVSENREESQKTLRILAEYLRLLEEPIEVAGDTINLVRRPNRGFKALACRVGALSGFRCIGWSADEAAKYRGEGSAQPAAENVASLRAMTITHPNARGRIFSSPMGRVGFFFDVFAAGDSERQIVTQGPSWEFNPTISVERTKILEPDHRIWAREYLSEFGSVEDGAFEAESIDRAFLPRRLRPIYAPITPVDLAGRGADSVVWMRAVYCADDSDEERFEVDEERSFRDVNLIAYRLNFNGQRIQRKDWAPPAMCLSFSNYGAIDGSHKGGRTADQIVETICAAAATDGSQFIACDQYSDFAYASLFSNHGFALHTYPISEASKALGVRRLRRLLNEGAVHFAPSARFREELLGYREVMTDSGVSYKQTRSVRGHFDMTSAAIVACLAELACDLQGGVVRKRNSTGAMGPGDFGNA